MSEVGFSYLGKFEFNEGSSPGLNILVIKEDGVVRFVGEGVDHAGDAETPDAWEAQLRALLPELGIETEAFHYVAPFA